MSILSLLSTNIKCKLFQPLAGMLIFTNMIARALHLSFYHVMVSIRLSFNVLNGFMCENRNPILISIPVVNYISFYSLCNAHCYSEFVVNLLILVHTRGIY